MTKGIQRICQACILALLSTSTIPAQETIITLDECYNKAIEHSTLQTQNENW